jgi:hypothetical protein
VGLAKNNGNRKNKNNGNRKNKNNGNRGSFDSAALRSG